MKEMKTMVIKILYDRKTSDEKLAVGWGLSFLVDKKILFDAGETGSALVRNALSLGEDFDKLENIIISHDHWDHTGGLNDVLDRKKGLKVFVCPGYPELEKSITFRGGVPVNVEKSGLIISPNFFSSGPLPTFYKQKILTEQSLIIKTSQGVSVLTGCAHPGIVVIAEAVRGMFPTDQLYMIAGGMHLKDATPSEIEATALRLKSLGFQKAGPSHCSEELAEAIFKQVFKQGFVEVEVGRELTI